MEEISWEQAREIQRIFEGENGDLLSQRIRLPKGPASRPAEKGLGDGRMTAAMVKERMTACFQYLYDNKRVMKVLFSSNADRYLATAAQDIFGWAWNEIVDLRKHIPLDQESYRLASTAYGWGAYYLIREWLTADIEKSPEEITELFLQLPGRNIYG